MYRLVHSCMLYKTLLFPFLLATFVLFIRSFLLYFAMDCVQVFTCLAQSKKRKHWTAIVETEQMALQNIQKNLAVAQVQLAAMPEVKAEDLTEAQAKKDAALVEAFRASDEVTFSKLAVNDEIWVPAETTPHTTGLCFTKATVQFIEIKSLMEGRLQYKVHNSGKVEVHDFYKDEGTVAETTFFQDACFLATTFKALNENDTTQFYRALASVLDEVIYFC